MNLLCSVSTPHLPVTKIKTALVDGCQRTIYYIQLDRHR